jgi:hypothetical protein
MQKAISDSKSLLLRKKSPIMTPLNLNINCLKEDCEESDPKDKVSFRERNVSWRVTQHSQSIPKGFDPSQWKAFQVLQEFLQPKSTTLLKDTVNRIIMAFPESEWILTSLNEIFIEVAQQIPYNHQSLHKLAAIVCLFGRGIGVRPSDRVDEKKVSILVQSLNSYLL